MTMKFEPGQQDTAANSPGEQKPTGQGSQPGDEPKTAAEKVRQSVEAGDTATVDEAVAVNPYPAYEDLSLEDLRSAAASRNVEINRDVEKAHLVHQLRLSGESSPAYDLLPLDELRKVAGEKDVALDEEFEKAHLITELRAADTHTL